MADHVFVSWPPKSANNCLASDCHERKQSNKTIPANLSRPRASQNWWYFMSHDLGLSPFLHLNLLLFLADGQNQEYVEENILQPVAPQSKVGGECLYQPLMFSMIMMSKSSHVLVGHIGAFWWVSQLVHMPLQMELSESKVPLGSKWGTQKSRGWWLAIPVSQFWRTRDVSCLCVGFGRGGTWRSFCCFVGRGTSSNLRPLLLVENGIWGNWG